MAKAKTLKEEIFGGVSEYKGMCSGGGKNEKLPKAAEHYQPRYHEGEQINPDTIESNEEVVTEKELSSHF